jgi:two-component system sensor histidine kinase HydH
MLALLRQNMKDLRVKERSRFGAFPTSVFVIVVALVCLGLAVSAGYNYVRLSRLRAEYLHNSAAEIASALDLQARGPNRSNPSFWQSLFAQIAGARGSSLGFLALVDDSGNVLASDGDRFASVFSTPIGFVRCQATELYIYESVLATPRMGMGTGMGGGAGMGPGMGRRAIPRRLRIGMYSSAADFIWWQALFQLAMNGVAIIALLVLARYFLRTLLRFMRLKARDESDRHLAAIGGMAATLAHEIRNPLGAMKGLTQLAQEDLPKDHKTQSLMNTVVSEAERLEQLVTDLLTFARPRDPQISRFDFAHLLSDLKAALQPKLETVRVNLGIDANPPELIVYSDESGLRQVLLNVLLNAIDSTPADGRVTIRARRDDKTQMLIAEIEDSGSGLGGRDPEELFQPFATTKAKGTGLGLPISRQIVERLGGTMDLADRPDGGARCTITLPLQSSV